MPNNVIIVSNGVLVSKLNNIYSFCTFIIYKCNISHEHFAKGRVKLIKFKGMNISHQLSFVCLVSKY